MSGIAITFPSSPSEGQVHLAQNGFTYIYDSNKNRWKRGGEFVRAPKVLSYAGVAATTTGNIPTAPNGTLIYQVPGLVVPNSTVGVDSYKAYRAADSYPDHTEIQVSISSAFSSIAYAATFTGTTHTIPSGTLSGLSTYYIRARQFEGSDASAAGVGAISGYSGNYISFATTSTYVESPTIVSIAGTTAFPVSGIGDQSTTLPLSVTFGGSGTGNLERVDIQSTGPTVPSSTGVTALAEPGVGTHSSLTLANALVLAMPLSGGSGAGIEDEVNTDIRTASSASSGSEKTPTANGNAAITTIAGMARTSHYYNGAAYFDGSGDYISFSNSSDFAMGTGDFTFECWFHQTASTAYTPLLEIGNHTGAGIMFMSRSPAYGNKISTYSGGRGSAIADKVIHLNQWYHAAFTRKDGTLRIFVDGELCGVFPDFNDNLTATGTCNIARSPSYSYIYTGYIQDVRLYKGIAKYAENFIPPDPVFGAITYTGGERDNVGVATTAVLQSTGDNIGIAETTSTAANALVLALPMNKTTGCIDYNVVIRGATSGASHGTVKVVGLGTTAMSYAPSHPRATTLESKHYDSSMCFNGSAYAAYATSSDDFAAGSGDYTIECWVNFRSFDGTPIIVSAGTGGFSLGANSSGQIFMYRNGGGGWVGTWNNSNLATDRWYHIAACTSTSGTWEVYLNGSSLGTKSGYSGEGTTAPLYISTYGNGVGGQTLNGYVQDVRLYKGFRKYNNDFTPPGPICGLSTNISEQIGFTTTRSDGALLSSVVGLGTTVALTIGQADHYAGITTITSSSGITTLPDPYAQNLVLALPLISTVAAGNTFTSDRTPQIKVSSGLSANTAKTVTIGGNVSVATTSRLYNQSVYFFGTGNTNSYLNIANNSDFDWTSSDWTIECWVYFTRAIGTQEPICASATDYKRVGIFRLTNGKMGYFASSNGSSWDLLVGDGAGTGSGYMTVPSNQWNHIVYQRKGTVFTAFVNGNVDLSKSVDGSVYNQAEAYTIGRWGQVYSMQGYIQDFRIYKGVAKYTTDFTPPPPVFGDYVRQTPSKIIAVPDSTFTLKASNTTVDSFESGYGASRQISYKKSTYPPSQVTYNGTNNIQAINEGFSGEDTVKQDSGAGALVCAWSLNNNQQNYATNVANLYVGLGTDGTGGDTNAQTPDWINGNGSGSNTFSFNTSIKKWSGYTASIGQEGGGGGGPYWQAPIPDDSTVDWSNGYTIECWLYPRTFAGGSWNESGGIFTGYGNYRGYVQESNPNSVTTLYFYDGNISLEYAPTVDHWMHLAMVGDPETLKERIYINGEFLGYRGRNNPGKIGSTNLNNTNSSQNGRLASNGYRYNGYYQDYRVYNYQKYN